MSKPRDERQKDLFRPALEQIIDMGHPLVRLGQEIDWFFLEQRFASVCTWLKSCVPASSHSPDSLPLAPFDIRYQGFFTVDYRAGGHAGPFGFNAADGVGGRGRRLGAQPGRRLLERTTRAASPRMTVLDTKPATSFKPIRHQFRYRVSEFHPLGVCRALVCFWQILLQKL